MAGYRTQDRGLATHGCRRQGGGRATATTGWFFGWFGNESEAARARVRKHVTATHQQLGAEALAELLDEAGALLDDRQQLALRISSGPAWAGWAVDADSGQLKAHRAASLRWLLEQSESGALGAVEREMLATPDWRLALSQPQIRAAAKSATAATAQSGNHVAVASLAAWLEESLAATRPDALAFVDSMRASIRQLACADRVVEAARHSPEVAGRVKAVVQLSTGPFGSGDPNRGPFRQLFEQARQEIDMHRRRLDAIKRGQVPTFRIPHSAATYSPLR